MKYFLLHGSLCLYRANLHAAWNFDDGPKDELARTWRGRAADKFLAVLNDGQLFAEELGGSEAIVID